MNDRLDVRLEMTWVVAIWSFFDFLQYIFYFFSQFSDCENETKSEQFMSTYSNLFAYITIVVRDLTTFFCMLYFMFRVNRRENNIQTELSKDDSPHDCQEFKTMLNSCRPLICFSGYIEKKKPEFICLLDYIKAHDTIEYYEIELGDIKKKKIYAERILGQNQQNMRQSILDESAMEKIN